MKTRIAVAAMFLCAVILPARVAFAAKMAEITENEVKVTRRGKTVAIAKKGERYRIIGTSGELVAIAIVVDGKEVMGLIGKSACRTVEVAEDEHEQDKSNSEDFYQAVRRGDLRRVKELLDKGVDVNGLVANGVVPLLVAADRGHVEVAELLIQRGADVNAANQYGDTPLHEAAYEGHTDLVRLLLENGARVNAKDSRGKTPMDGAREEGNEEIIRLLRGRVTTEPDRLPVEERDPDRRVLEFFAELRRKIEENPGLVNTGGEEGGMPLHQAAYYGHGPTVHFLLSKGADVDAIAVRGRKGTALYLATERTHVDIVEILLANGADPNILMRGPSTALDLAESMLSYHTEQLAETGDTEHGGRKMKCAAIVSLLKEHRALAWEDLASKASSKADADLKTEALLSALSHPDRSLRGDAAAGLGKVGDPRALQPLLEALGDPEETLRAGAAAGLGYLANEQAVGALLAAMRDPEKTVRASAATALGRIGDNRAVNALILALNDVREEAVEALGEIGDPRAVAPLAKLFREWDSPYAGRKVLAARALAKLGRPGLEALARELPRVEERSRRDVVGMLAEVGPDAVPVLVAVLQTDEDMGVRCEAASSLGKIGDTRAVKPLLAAMREKLMIRTPGFEDIRDYSLTHASIGALGEIGDVSAIPELIAMTEDPAMGGMGSIGAQNVLRKITGVDIGVSVEGGPKQWAKWWKKNKDRVLAGQMPSQHERWEGWTLHDAVQKADEEAVKKLIADGADVNEGNERGRTPLHLAAMLWGQCFFAPGGGLAPMPVGLPPGLSRGGPAPAPKPAGDTSEKKARYLAIAEALLRAGADPNIADDRGAKPWNFVVGQATLGVDRTMVDLLKRYGADIPRGSTERPRGEVEPPPGSAAWIAKHGFPVMPTGARPVDLVPDLSAHRQRVAFDGMAQQLRSDNARMRRTAAEGLAQLQDWPIPEVAPLS